MGMAFSKARVKGLQYLPLIQQFLNTVLGSKLYLFKFLDKYGEKFRCLNT